MTTEPEYNAHYRCGWCHSVRAKSEVVHLQGVPLCIDRGCLSHMKRQVDTRLFNMAFLPDHVTDRHAGGLAKMKE